LNNGIEYVTMEKAEEEEEEEMFKEKYGVERIKEALETNMWSTMKYKTALRPDSNKHLLGVGEADISEIGQVAESIAKQLQMNDKNSHDQDQIPTAKENSETQLSTNETVQVSPKPSNTTNAQTLKLDVDSLLFKEDEEEKINDLDFDADINLDDMESFEKTLRTLTSLREQAKQLPDKERREMAAKVALSLFQQLGDE